MQDNHRQQADEDFNNSVETFLMSGVNVSRNPKLQNCYNQLIETIYRIEFPSNAQQPQIRSLSATCNWSWNEQDYKTADAVAKLVLAAPTETVPSNGLITLTSTVAANAPTQGFNEQKFEASPLDELAKLELTPEEQDVTGNPIAQQQYQYIHYDVRIVRAKTGDTVTKIAVREGVSAVKLTKYNGLLPASTLSAGREIKILSTSKSQPRSTGIANAFIIGRKEEMSCKNSISPVVQNLTLGMTVSEVSKKLNKTIIVKKLPNVSPETYLASISNLKGVRQLSL